MRKTTAAILLGATLALTPNAASAATVGTSSMSIEENAVLREINARRSSVQYCGGVKYKPAKRLRWSAKLSKAANAHSTDMAENDYFSHYSLSGASPFKRIRAYRYRFRTAGENIAAGLSLSSASAVVNAWMRSPGHCRVIMNPKYRDLGVAQVYGPGRWGVYWTADFARKR